MLQYIPEAPRDEKGLPQWFDDLFLTNRSVLTPFKCLPGTQWKDGVDTLVRFHSSLWWPPTTLFWRLWIETLKKHDHL